MAITLVFGEFLQCLDCSKACEKAWRVFLGWYQKSLRACHGRPYLQIRTAFGSGGMEHVDMHTSLASQAHGIYDWISTLANSGWTCGIGKRASAGEVCV